MSEMNDITGVVGEAVVRRFLLATRFFVDEGVAGNFSAATHFFFSSDSSIDMKLEIRRKSYR